MRVLVTNDDGIESPGLAALAQEAAERGHDVLVVAPCWDSSGASASVTGVVHEDRVRTEPRQWTGWPEGSVLAVDATPALICRTALEAGFGPPPELVLSGINRGPNTGRAILHSGTVGAAFTAYHGGCSGLAVSLAVREPLPGPFSELHWATAAGVAGLLVDWLVAARRPVVLNCNVPNVPPPELRGLVAARLALVGTSATSVTEDAGGAIPVALGAGIPEPLGADGADITDVTDAVLVARGYASVTAVVPVAEDPTVDLAGVVDRPLPAP
ncbi:MAG TPA: 5'/3'-nucleotidase SurE [Acidimicrobiales bacterium]